MKLSLLLVLFTLLQANAAVIAQEVSIKVKDASLIEVFKQLKKQTGYDFIYVSEDLKHARPVSLQFDKQPLLKVLAGCFENQPLSYEIKNTTVLVRKKTPLSSKSQPIELYEQQKKITGTILNAKHEPLPGVSIRVKNTQTITSSDSKGRFTISVAADNAVLVFSFMGYALQEIPIAGKEVINVVLKEQNTGLDEVVVIGYGEVQRKDLTGAVSSVNIEDMSRAPVRSFEEALAGRIAGVQVTSDDGQPGSPISIVIRGQNSLTQANSPLYVIDGFPIEDPENNAINPDDIESIDVLKDASATAIYGARGANGVVIITTKAGKEGTPSIKYSGYYGNQDMINEIKVMDPYEFVKYMLERIPNVSTNLYLSDGKTLEDYRDIQGVNWQNEIFRDAPMHNHTLSLSGGTKTTKYMLSGSLLDQDGLIINSGYQRAQMRLRLDQTVNSKMKIGVNVNYSAMKRYGKSPIPTNGSQFTSALMYSAWGYRPVTGGDDTDFIDEGLDDDVNPAIDHRFNPKLTAENELRNNFGNVLFMNGYAEYIVARNLKLRVSAGATLNAAKIEEFNNSDTPLGSPSTLLGRQRGVNGQVINQNTNNYLNENTLSYSRNFNNRKNRLDAVLGFTMQRTESNSYGAGALHVPNEALGIAGLDEGTPMSIISTDSEATMASFLGRVNYTHNSKYLFTATFRADGSSKFSYQNRWSYFPSGAFAWRLSEESFMKDINFISDAKIRTSYGITGNNRIPDFAYLTRISLPYIGSYPFNNAIVKGSYPTSIGNPQLRWENTQQFDLGIDLGLFDDKVSIVADYYNKTTTDLLLNASLPTSLGFDAAFKNIGRVENRGFEFTLNTTNIDKRNFSWTTNFNIAFNRGKVLELTQNQESMLSNINWDQSYRSLPLYIAKIGRPIAMFYGYVWEGNYQYADFDQVGSTYVLRPNVPTNGNDRNVIQPGDIKYKDINGDGVVDANDMTIIGDPNPDFIGGFTNNFRYKGFDLNVFFQFSYGNEAFNANRLILEGGGQILQTNMFETYVDRWTPENQNNTYFRTNGQGPFAYSSRVVEDASFLRLKTVALGYTIPSTYLNSIGINACRIYVSAQNLITWTAYQGFDPEVSAKNSALTPAFDFSVYPRARTVVAGINLTL